MQNSGTLKALGHYLHTVGVQVVAVAHRNGRLAFVAVEGSP